MSRVAVDWRSASKKNYEDFNKKHPLISLTFDEWRNILYGFNESFKHYILETGEKEKLPTGFGEFSINKKKRSYKSLTIFILCLISIIFFIKKYS